jgi:HSP20 family protein
MTREEATVVPRRIAHGMHAVGERTRLARESSAHGPEQPGMLIALGRGGQTRRTAMSIFRRNTDANDKTLTTRETDPFRWMRDFVEGAMPQWPQWVGPSWEQSFSPAFEVKETKDSFQFLADLPGMKEADVDLKITGNRLAITGKREAEKEDKGDTYYTYERAYGSFQRTFILPDGVDTDHVHAELKNGVLTIAIPKKATVPTKTVAFKTGEKS